MKLKFYFLPGFILSLFFSVSSFGQSGNVLSLSGSGGSYMSVADHADLNIAPGQSKTITCWIKTTSTATSRIVAKRANANTLNPGTAGTTGTGYELWMGNGANAGKIAGNATAWNTTSSSSQTFSTQGYNAGTANDGSWHHLAMVFDNASATKSVLFYLDAGTPNSRTGITPINNYDFTTSVALIVGAASDGTNLFTGQIDDVRFWNIAMTQAQVLADMTTSVTGATTNLLAAWNFENVTGTTVPDVSGNNHPGTLNGNATIISINSVYQGTTLIQTELPTGIGNVDQRVIAINVQMNGAANLTSLALTMAGTTNIADVTSIKIYYTGANSRFNTATQFATVAPASGTLTATGTQALASGSNYFWIAYDVSGTATEGDLLDATCESITVGGTAYTFASPNNTVSGSRTILLANTLLVAPGDAGAISYRIPAIVTAADGSLVTVTDKRWNNSADLRNKIDPEVRRSTDNGKTWSAPVVIANFGGPNGAGDPALVVDRIKNPGTILCLFAANQGLAASTPTVPINIQYCKSTDNGITWSAPVDITNQIYGANCSNPYTKSWYAAFVASGRMYQLRSGRITGVVAVRQTSAGTLDNFTIYSDDGGTTWAALTSDPTTHGIAAAGQADEAKVLELDNGNLLMSTRHAGNRRFSTSTDKGLTWSTPPVVMSQLVEPGCDGDFIRYTSTIDGFNKSRLLHSIPNNSGTRKNVSVFISYDEGATWNTSKAIFPQASAYSSLTILPDGTIGLYYENGEYGDVYDMYFVRFSLSWLTNGADTYTPAAALPVTLVSFNGKLAENKRKVDLNWVTTNEINVKKFEVEYSNDGTDFTRVGDVTAEGGSQMLKNYSFAHDVSGKSGSVYYRLKMVDIDGSFKYSIVLRFKLEGSQSLTVYPNPVTDRLVVNAGTNNKATLQVFSLATGETVRTMSVTSAVFTMDVANLPGGMYLVKLISQGSAEVTKFVKQ